VHDFEAQEELNLAGGKHRAFTDGPVAVGGRYSRTAQNGFYQISYGGSVGDPREDAPGFAYALWSTDLGGINCLRCGTLSFLIRGSEGGEKPNIYLDDGNHRWGVDIEKYTPVTKSWQRVTIPLADFAQYGVDLSHLYQLQFVFEWEKMSGTVYVDDIRFGRVTAPTDTRKHETTNTLAVR
jgi:hypothetical protein